jgi:hypothetical protein
MPEWVPAISREWLLAIAPVVSAFAAVLAILIGAWVQRRNLNATLRQKRAEDFRTAAAQFVSNIQTIRNLEIHTAESEIARRQQLRDELPSITYKLHLLLDPEDKLQKRLRGLLEPLWKETDKDEFIKRRDEVLDLARLVSDQEYEKARRGK